MKKATVIALAALISIVCLVCFGCDGCGAREYRTVSAIENASFETGDLSGWTAEGNAFTADSVVEASADMRPQINGRYYLSGAAAATGATGTLTSTPFVLQDTGYVSFLIGGGKDTELCYVAICTDGGEEVKRVGNTRFTPDGGLTRVLIDLRERLNQTLIIKIVDKNDKNDYSYLEADGFDVNVTETDLAVYGKNSLKI